MSDPQPESIVQRVLQRIESAWLTSAQRSHCWDLEVKGEADDEQARRIMPAMRLSSGHSIPAIGLGVYLSAAGEETYSAVRSALKLGYRHVDTAQIYGNEADVGRAVADSGLPREEVFVTTKLWKTNWGYEQAKAAVRESLQKLGGGYIDLLLLHAPGDPASRPDTWRALEDCVQEGLVRSIGVSNFGVPHLKKLAETARISPAVNQIELHPWCQWPEVVDYCKQNNIVVEAYSPLAKGRKLEHPAVVEISQRLGKTAAQVLLRWGLQHGYVVLPKSVSPERQRANLGIVDWALGEGDMAALDGLDSGEVTGWDPIREDAV